jgi:hypothetical protein
VSRSPRTEHDEGLRHLTPFRVGHAHDRSFEHRRMTEQRAFHFDGGNVLATADDHVLVAISDLDISGGVHHSGIADRNQPPRRAFAEASGSFQ